MSFLKLVYSALLVQCIFIAGVHAQSSDSSLYPVSKYGTEAQNISNIKERFSENGQFIALDPATQTVYYNNDKPGTISIWGKSVPTSYQDGDKIKHLYGASSSSNIPQNLQGLNVKAVVIATDSVNKMPIYGFYASTPKGWSIKDFNN